MASTLMYRNELSATAAFKRKWQRAFNYWRKLSDRSTPGIPDALVGHRGWLGLIEFKLLRRGGGNIKAWDACTPRQRDEMRKVADTSCVALLIWYENQYHQWGISQAAPTKYGGPVSHGVTFASLDALIQNVEMRLNRERWGS